MTPHRDEWSIPTQPIAIVLALAVAAYLSWLIVRPFLSVFAWAVVMTVLFFPAHRRLEARLGQGGWTALLSTALVILMVLAPTAFVITATVGEVREISQGMPTTIGGWLDPENPASGQAVQAIERVVSLERFRDPAFLERTLDGWGSGVTGRPLRFVGGALGAVVQLGLIVFTIFFLFKDARRIRTCVYDLVPIENRRLRALFVRTHEVIVASVYGTLLLAVIQGALGGLAFLVLGLPSPFLWGVVMTLAAIVPMLGAFIVWVPAALYLVASGDVWPAVGLTVWGTVVIGLADNVLRPILVGNRTRMHELLIFFGVLGGLKAFGALGLVMGPVIFAVTLALVQALREVGAPRTVSRAAA